MTKEETRGANTILVAKPNEEKLHALQAAWGGAEDGFWAVTRCGLKERDLEILDVGPAPFCRPTCRGCFGLIA